MLRISLSYYLLLERKLNSLCNRETDAFESEMLRKYLSKAKQEEKDPGEIIDSLLNRYIFGILFWRFT